MRTTRDSAAQAIGSRRARLGVIPRFVDHQSTKINRNWRLLSAGTGLAERAAPTPKKGTHEPFNHCRIHVPRNINRKRLRSQGGRPRLVGAIEHIGSIAHADAMRQPARRLFRKQPSVWPVHLPGAVRQVHRDREQRPARAGQPGHLGCGRLQQRGSRVHQRRDDTGGSCRLRNDAGDVCGFHRPGALADHRHGHRHLRCRQREVHQRRRGGQRPHDVREQPASLARSPRPSRSCRNKSVRSSETSARARPR